MNMARFRSVFGFLLLWLLADIFWHFILRGFGGQHPDNPAVQGLVADTVA